MQQLGKDNTHERYYDNRDYFRPGRRQRKQQRLEAAGEA